MPAKILVLSASVGAGHLRAAQAVELALKQLAPADAEVRNVDVLALTNAAFRKLYGEAYLDLVNKAPHVLGFFYDYMDRPKKPNSKRDRLRLAWEKLNLRKFCEYVECERWDVVVNTHFLPPEIIRSLKKQGKLRVPQVTVVTDFDAHALWVNDPLDQYCCATAEASAYMQTFGVPADHITVTGIPIHPLFSKPRERNDVLKAHGLKEDRPIVLQLAGGFGVGPIEKLFRSILSIEKPIEVVVVAGRNEKVKGQLEAVDVPSRHRAKVMGFTDKMDGLMAAADVVVTKPGGLTSSEILARGAAMAIVNPIPGQESRNSDYLLEHGAAIKINNAATLPLKLNELLGDPKRLETLKRNARRIAKPQAAFDVARLALAQLCVLLAILFGFAARANAAEPASPLLVNLDSGYRATIGGACAVAPDGRVLMLTTGPEVFSKEAFPAIRAELWTSRDNGKTWAGPKVLHRGRREDVMLPSSILRLASGKMLIVLGLYGGYDFVNNDPAKSLLEFYTQTSSDNGDTWSEPKRIDATWRYVNSPLAILQLKSGRVLIPSGYLTEQKGRSVISALYSDDDGATWKRSPSILDVAGEGFESGPAEPTAVELPDGRVWMLMRTQTGLQYESFSTDGGATWSDAKPSRFTSSSAPATFVKLRDGRIALVWSNSVASPYARHSLLVAISDDGGKTFRGYRELAKVEYPLPSLEKRWGVAYAFPCEAADGTLLVPFNTGDWTTMRLRVARVDPKWIGQTSLVDDFTNGIGAWCDVGAIGISYGAALDGGPGMEMSIGSAPPAPCGSVRNVPLVRKGTISFTVVPRKGPTYLLLHDSFLDPGKFEDACLRVRFDDDGKAHIGAGTPTERKIGEMKFQPVYAYTAYPVKDEASYPIMVEAQKPCVVNVRLDVAASKAFMKINDGPEVERTLGKSIEGICYVGVAASEGGKIRVQRVESRND